MPAEARSMLTIEPAETDADLDDLLSVRNAVEQEPMSRATLAGRLAEEIAGYQLVAREGGVGVGAGAVGWTSFMLPAGEAAIRVWVLLEHRRRGIGSELFDRLAAFARMSGIAKGFVRVLASDTQSVEFMRHRGLEVVGSNQVGRYDLAGRPSSEPVEPPEGISFASRAERPDLERALYELEAITIAEVPSLADKPVPSYEVWREHLAEPFHLRDMSLLAHAGDAVVGSIQVLDDGDGTAFIEMLSVAPDMRRRGIARALKRELARRAAAAGWKRLETINDDTNEGIRRLNEELGYRYLPEVLLLEGPLPTS